MSTSTKGVVRGLVAAIVLIGLMVAPLAAGIALAAGMRASGGALRAPGGMGARLGRGGLAGGAMMAPGARRGVMPGAGTAVRTMPSEGAFGPLLPNVVVRPLAPGTVIIPVSPTAFFFPGGVISPIVPGTVVNPLLPGTIFVPLFPVTSFFPVFPSTVFVTVFPSRIFTAVFPSAIFFPLAPSIINPLTPGIVPPLIPQFVVVPLPTPLAEVSDPAAATVSTRAGTTAARGRTPAAGPAVMPARTAAGAMRAAAPRQQPSDARARQEWVRTQNPGTRAAGPKWGTAGGAVAGTVVSAGGRASTEARDDPGDIERTFGRPTHRVAFVPRTVFFDDFFSMSDGRVGFKQFKHHPAVAADFYYAHYRSDPSWFAFRHPGDYPSVYALWGWTPPWISADRVSYVPRNGLSGPSYLDYQGFGGDVDSVGAMNCIDGIRRAWLSGDPQRLAPYLSDRLDVRVYFNGTYEYSTPARDYYAMTVDALRATRTTALEFDNPVWLSAGDVVVTGRNGFTGPDGNPRTVYVSYRVRRVGNGWYITEAGSSLEPVQPHRQGLAG